jgi:von Willebrand factor type A domain
MDVSDTPVADASNPVPGVMNAWCPGQIQRLTNVASDVQSQISAMTAGGETYIASGLIWGWRVLSPHAPFADGAAYNTATKKIMVLMTDGANTHSPNYPDHEGTDVPTGNSLTAQVCTNIKAAGIDLYVIAFTVTDQTALSMLQACATGPVYFYNTNTIADLTSAFQTIGTSLTQVRLVN